MYLRLFSHNFLIWVITAPRPLTTRAPINTLFTHVYPLSGLVRVGGWLEHNFWGVIQFEEEDIYPRGKGPL